MQPPADVGGELLRLGAGEEHAEVQGAQELALRDPPLLLDQLAVHYRDLARGTPEVDEPELDPEPQRLPEPYRGLRAFGRLRREGFGSHRLFVLWHAAPLRDGRLHLLSVLIVLGRGARGPSDRPACGAATLREP